MRLGLSILFVAGIGQCTTAPDIPCTEFPYVKLEEVIHSNLGRKGPDAGEEGLFYRVSLKNVGLSQTTAHLRIHAVTEYTPTWNAWNGLNGEWGRINFDQGTAAGFSANFWDPDTKKNLTLTRGYMTFSDLDAGPQAKEFVTVSNFFVNYYVGDQAKLTVEPHILVTMFWGQDVEMGSDNPGTASKLTMQSKRKAVTLQVGDSGLQVAIFRLGATTGWSSRTVEFNFQATMLCAKTQMPDGRLLAATDTSQGNVFPRAKGGEPVTDFSKYNICTGKECDHLIGA